MRERFSGIWDMIKSRWSAMSRQLKILLLGGGAVVLVVAMILVMLLNQTNYTVLYNNLTPIENAEVITQLQSIGIPVTLEGTALLVPDDQRDAAVMHMAIAGMPMDPGVGFEIFQQGAGLTSTQADREFFENVQTQVNIANMIRTIPEIMNVSVIVNPQETGAFIFAADRLPAQAAVNLELLPGRSLSAEQVQGILSIVTASVPGISADNVAITAGGLNLLFDINSAGGGDAQAQVLRLTEQVNETFRRRVLNMLNHVYGVGNVDVRVNSVLDTTDRTTESITYIPFDSEDPRNNPVNFFESEAERTFLDGPAGGVPGATDNIDVPMYAAEADDGEGVHFYARNVIDFLVSSEHTLLVGQGMDIVEMSVAVLVNMAEMADAERDMLVDLVAMASGVPVAQISVQNLAFYVPADQMAEELSIFQNPLFWVLVAVGLLLIAGAVAFLIIRRRRASMIVDAIDLEEGDNSLIGLMGQDEDFEPIQLPETQEQKLKLQIKDLADSDPEIVAQLIRTWLVGAN